MNENITITRNFFEHLLICLSNQKFINKINADALECSYKEIQQENQKIIDTAWMTGMDLLRK